MGRGRRKHNIRKLLTSLSDFDYDDIVKFLETSLPRKLTATIECLQKT